MNTLSYLAMIRAEKAHAAAWQKQQEKWSTLAEMATVALLAVLVGLIAV